VLQSAYFLYLARFVTLTNEDDVKILISAAASHYAHLYDLLVEMPSRIHKNDMYGKEIYGTNLTIKLKTIIADNCPLHYSINEGVALTRQNDKSYQLDGVGAHTMRHARFTGGLNEPIDMYSVHADSCDYNFPHQIWNDLMQLLVA